MRALRRAETIWPVVLAALTGTLGGSTACATQPQGASSGSTTAVTDEPRQEALRRRMVTRQIEARGISDPAVRAALTAVPRHRFVPAGLRSQAYDDGPLPIGDGQTISQPYIVGLMTELIRPKPTMRVLEIGTGSGYQAAVLSRCVAEVDTIEVRPTLGHQAERLLKELGYGNVRVRVADGYDGWPERAPYDAVILTAAPPEIPRPLIDQLKIGGRLVAPVGGQSSGQELVVLTRTEKGITRQAVIPVAFVPMIGKAGGAPAPPP
jgi:protein-L-isoaspartate(D-aspartate) O-methyltransferase